MSTNNSLIFARRQKEKKSRQGKGKKIMKKLRQKKQRNQVQTSSGKSLYKRRKKMLGSTSLNIIFI